MHMDIIDQEFGVPTTQLLRTVDFYVLRLFFEKLSESAHACTIALGKDRVTFREAHRDEVRSLRNMGFGLSFRLRGIQDYYQRIRTAGMTEFQQELELMQPGVWQFSVRDPNEFLVVFSTSANGGAP